MLFYASCPPVIDGGAAESEPGTVREVASGPWQLVQHRPPQFALQEEFKINFVNMFWDLSHF